MTQRIVLIFLLCCIVCTLQARDTEWRAAQRHERASREEKVGGSEKPQKVEEMADSLVYSYELIKAAATKPATSAYIGCFTVTKLWKITNSTEVKNGRNNDVITCIRQCWERRLRFALLKKSIECFCTDVIRGLTKADNSLCHMSCAGNSTQVCGSSETFSAYYTGYVKEPLFTHINQKGIVNALEGCYKDMLYSVLCPFHVFTTRLNVPMCMAFCEDNAFQYAALDSTVKCCCTKTLQGAVKVKANFCPLRCKTGGPDDSCGGKRGFLAVYATDVSTLITDVKPKAPTYYWIQANIDDETIQKFGHT